jgi:CBS domain containing-hemolysin-like protein
LLGVSERAGVLKREERIMVNRILALEELQVREVMTPRVDIQFLEDNLSPADSVAALRRYKHRRVPVFHESRDNVVGILNAKDFLADSQKTLGDLLEPPQVVPETMSVARMLRLFRHQEHPVAIVVDEHGGTAGLVTLEDVLEEIVGEIEDEFDSSEIMIQRQGDGKFLINGKARLELVNEQCGIALEAQDVDTIAGWMISKLDSLPKEGQIVREGRVRVTARKIIRHRLSEVSLEVEGR